MTTLPKFMQRMLDEQGNAPRVLIRKWKHGTTYHDATGEKLFAVALEILTQTVEEWHYIPSVVRAKQLLAEAKAQVDLPQELAEQLPESIRKQALRIAKDQRANVGVFESILASAREAEQALAEQDGRLAYMILNDRRNHEYEGFELYVLLQPAASVPVPASG